MQRKIEHRGHRKYINGARLYWYCDYPEFWDFFKGCNKDNKIVDAGCGKGVVADELSLQGFKNIELMDIQDIRVLAKDKPFHKVDFNHDKFPFADNSIDLVVSTAVIEHLENQYHYLREIHRILKPGGRLVITMPSCWNIISRLLFLKTGGVESFHGTNHHINVITKNIFDFMLKDKFKEISRFYIHRTNLGFKPFCYFKVKMPQTEFWGGKVAYLLSKP